MAQVKRKNKSQRQRARKPGYKTELEKSQGELELRSKQKKQKKIEIEENINEPVSKKVTFSPNVVDNEPDDEHEPSKKRRKLNLDDNIAIDVKSLTPTELNECLKPQNVKNVGSNRQMKRNKFEKLKAEQKLKSDTLAQQKSLSYLSLWKHNRSEWKFEKLRQVWLQHNMFDSVMVPDKFWETLIKYFSGSKGHVRQALFKNCMKIIEDSDKTEASKEESQKEADKIKLTRARNLLQCLEE